MRHLPVLSNDGVTQHINLLVAALETVVLGLGLGQARPVLLLLQNFTHGVCDCSVCCNSDHQTGRIIVINFFFGMFAWSWHVWSGSPIVVRPRPRRRDKASPRFVLVPVILVLNYTQLKGLPLGLILQWLHGSFPRVM